MARLTSFAPFDFLRRLGVKDQGETRLELIESIQPVIGVADASSLFPPILPPTAWFGAVQPAVALERATFTVRPGPRGAYLRVFNCNNNAAVVAYNWRVVDRPGLGVTPVTAVLPHNMSERGDVLTTVDRGTDLVFLSLLAGGTPSGVVPGANGHGIEHIDIAYIAPGRLFEVQLQTTNNMMNAYFLIQDAFGPEPLA